MEVLNAHNTKGFVTVEYPPELYSIVLNAHQSWLAFCSLSVSQKERFSNGDRQKDFGYMHRTDKGKTADSKEHFHVTKRDLPELRRRSVDMPGEAIVFIESCEELIIHSSGLILEYAKAIEDQYGIGNFAQNVEMAADRYTFRFLHYFKGNVLAHPHADRGGFTLHLHETKSGGEYLDRSGSWQDWPIGEGQTIIFPGMLLQHVSQGAAKALWHRVVTKPGREDRYAMVVFIDFDYSHQYAHQRQRIADLPVGCTYDMSFEQFDRLFDRR